MAGAVIRDGCQLGQGVILHPGVVVGADGFGAVRTTNGIITIPQVGTVMVESRVSLGAQTCVDRATLGETRVGEGTATDNFVQVGHGSTIGRDTILVAYSGVAGSTSLGERSTLGARATVLGHLQLGEDTQVGACSMVHKNTEPGDVVSGSPAIPHKEWLKMTAAWRRLSHWLGILRRWKAPIPHPDSSTWLPHAPPFVFIDRIEELSVGQYGRAKKVFSRNEPCFQGHFPDDPIVPGVLLVEAMAQLTGMVVVGRALAKDERVLLLGVDNARFRTALRPGDSVIISAQITRKIQEQWVAECEVKLEGVRACTARVRVGIFPGEPL
jgi:3-hydroxymyristoyl/3-hydroxydecanoyl-(acyl carrier protein) dehydratase/acetyltransferase-like isoleucine patch superfamily enzyme